MIYFVVFEDMTNHTLTVIPLIKLQLYCKSLQKANKMGSTNFSVSILLD